MAFPIIPIRNAITTSELAPLAGSLQLGELAINTETNKLYVKGNAGVVEIGGTADALTTKDISQLAVPLKIPQLTTAGHMPLVQINGLTTGQMLPALTTMAIAGLVPQLGFDGKIVAGQLPASVAGALNYKGAWAVNTVPVIASGGVVGSGMAAKGDYYVATNTANLVPPIDGKASVQTGDLIAFNGTTWDFIDGAINEVVSVNAVTPISGNITLTAAIIGAVSTDQLTQLATPNGVPQLDFFGEISPFQLPKGNVGIFGIVKAEEIPSNGFYVYGGNAKIIPGTSVVVGGVKSSASIQIAADGEATVASAGTY